MGILDHKRTWHFETAAGADECIAAFCEAMSAKSVLSFVKARWSVTRQGDSVVASYEGRAGLSGVGVVLSRRVAHEAATAVGSQLTFQVRGRTADGRRTACSMWLNRVNPVWIFFTADARFLRGYMNEVARRLRRLDSGLSVIKA